MAPCLCLVHKEHAIVQMDSYWLLLRRPTLLLGFVVDEASLWLIFSSSTLDSPCELNNRHYYNADAHLLSTTGTVAPWLYLSPQHPVTQSPVPCDWVPSTLWLSPQHPVPQSPAPCDSVPSTLWLGPQHPVPQSHPTSKNKEIFHYYLICR